MLSSIHSFMGQLDRIAARSYDPSDDDIVKARLRTLGVQENRIKFGKGTVPCAPLISGQIRYLMIKNRYICFGGW